MTPHIASLQLEELHTLRNQVRCTWLRHEPLPFSLPQVLRHFFARKILRACIRLCNKTGATGFG